MGSVDWQTIVEKIAAEAGWTDKTLLNLILDFIDAQSPHGSKMELIRILQEIKQSEEELEIPS